MSWTFEREGSYHLARKKTPASNSQEVPCLPEPLLQSECTLFPVSIKLVVSVMQERNTDPRGLGHSVDNFDVEYCQSQ